MRADAFNWHIYPVRTKMIGMQQVPISHVRDLDEIKSKNILEEKSSLQVYYEDMGEWESVIAY